MKNIYSKSLTITLKAWLKWSHAEPRHNHSYYKINYSKFPVFFKNKIKNLFNNSRLGIAICCKLLWTLIIEFIATHTGAAKFLM